MALTKRVVVVGGGIMGAATAHALHRRGVTDVVVLERMGPAAGATGLGGGVLSPVTWDPRDVRLVARSIEVYREAAGTPVPVGLPMDQPGGLTVLGDDDVDDARRILRLLESNDVDAEILETRELEGAPEAEEIRLPDGAPVLRCPADGWAAPDNATRRLLGEAHVDGGVMVQWFTPVDRIEEGPRVVLADGRAVEAEHVVLAAGAWTPNLLERSGLALPVEGYRAQCAVLGWPTPDAFPVIHDEPGGFYARPYPTGKLLVGDGTRLEPRRPELGEEMGSSADRDFLEDVAAGLAERVPEAAEAPILDSWSGTEAATPDRHPIAGPDPRMEGLHLLVGGNGFGFMRAPALAEAVVEGILEGSLPDDVARFAPERFAGDWDQEFEPREGFTLAPNPDA
jgi:sarcosine oxidase subunit beta